MTVDVMNILSKLNYAYECTYTGNSMISVKKPARLAPMPNVLVGDSAINQKHFKAFNEQNLRSYFERLMLHGCWMINGLDVKGCVSTINYRCRYCKEHLYKKERDFKDFYYCYDCYTIMCNNCHNHDHHTTSNRGFTTSECVEMHNVMKRYCDGLRNPVYKNCFICRTQLPNQLRNNQCFEPYFYFEANQDCVIEICASCNTSVKQTQECNALTKSDQIEWKNDETIKNLICQNKFHMVDYGNINAHRSDYYFGSFLNWIPLFEDYDSGTVLLNLNPDDEHYMKVCLLNTNTYTYHVVHDDLATIIQKLNTIAERFTFTYDDDDQSEPDFDEIYDDDLDTYYHNITDFDKQYVLNRHPVEQLMLRYGIITEYI